MLDGILIGLAVLCVVYFIIIVVYAGISTSFAFIWLFFAALLVFLVSGISSGALSVPYSVRG